MDLIKESGNGLEDGHGEPSGGNGSNLDGLYHNHENGGNDTRGLAAGCIVDNGACWVL